MIIFSGFRVVFFPRLLNVPMLLPVRFQPVLLKNAKDHVYNINADVVDE